MVLEPRGGDAHYIKGVVTQVVQYKLRGGATLTASDLCHRVLPDLWKAATAAGIGDADYVLQASAPLASSGREFLRLAREHCAGEPPDHPLDALPPLPRTLRFQRRRVSFHEAYFETLSACVHGKKGRPGDPTVDDQRRLWRLLARFEVAEPISAEELTRRIDRRMRALAPYPEEAEQHRRTLVAFLLERASEGGARLSVDELFERIELTREQAAARLRGPARLSEALQHALRARGYDRAVDVRPAVELAEGSVIAFEGESGAGKSWRLYRLAHDLDQAGEAVVLCRGTFDDLRRQPVEVAWYDALSQTRPMELASLPSRWREMTRAEGPPRLWLCWEPASAGDIRRALDAGWSRHGLVLALEAPSAMSSALSGRADLQRERVHRFSERELGEYLTRHGLDYAVLPSYVREPLRLPVLASIYAGVARGEPGWRPTSEYEVVGRFWRRLLGGPVHGGHPSDLAGIRRLANSFVDGTSRYPFGHEQLEAAGLGDANLERLERSGWLVRDERGRWSFGHDRLLNWAVAEVLVDRWAAAELEAPQLAGTVNRLSEGEWSGPPRRVPRLGFLLMDVIWLAARHDEIGADQLAALIREAERHLGHGYPGELYARLLPTADSTVLPALAARIRDEPMDTSPAFMARLFADGLLEIARLDRSRVVATAVALWRSPRGTARETALRVAASMPIAELREELWRELVLRSALLRQEEVGAHQGYEEAFKAVDQITQTDPAWLEAKVRAASGEDELAQCAWLIAGLEHPEAPSLWFRCKDQMFDGASEERVRGLATCVRRFEDGAELARLETWAREDRDHAAWVAWPALCELAALRALEMLAEVPAHVLAMTDRAWLLTLLEADGAGTRRRLREALGDRAPAGVHLAMVWKQTPDLLDAEMTTLLLNRLTVALRDRPGDDLRGAWHLVELLADGRISPAHHHLFINRRGSGLERHLADVARNRLARCSGIDRDWRLDHLMRLLARIDGRGYEELLIAGLEHANHLVRSESARAALRAPTPEVLSRLWLLAADLADEDEAQVVTVQAWRVLLVLDPTRARARIGNLLTSDDRNSQHWGAWLARQSGDKAHRPTIEALLARAEPGSDLEVGCLETALDLGADSEDMVECATRLLRNGDNLPPVALKVLLRSRSGTAKSNLDAHLTAAFNQPEHSFLNLQALAARCRQPDVPREVLSLVRRLPKHEFWYTPSLFHAVADHPSEDTQEALMEAAFSDAGNYGGPSPETFTALASIDREAAERAFARAWRLHARSRVPLAHLAPQLDPGAVVLIAAELPAEEDEATRRAICLALRRATQVAVGALEPLANSRWGSERQAAAEALGWLSNGSEFLQRLARDGDPAVRASARWSVLGRRREESALAWLARLDDAGEVGEYEVVDYALSLLAPELAGSGADRATVMPAIEHRPALSLFAAHRLEARRREIERPRLPRKIRRLRPSTQGTT
jgi:hypothetical protein